jgi:nucleoside-diphosphate-sugar epimerase
MQIIITGGAGFLGQRLSNALVNSKIKFDELLLVDIILPANNAHDPRVKCQQADLSADGIAGNLISENTGIVFHLAAIVSSHAEKDFDLGWRINLGVTRLLLEACRHTKSGIRFVFASSLAVFGGKLPPIVNESTVVTPSSSYGAQKAMAELLVNDYSRKDFVNGIVLRLPTVCVRPGRPNLAASSFVSSIIREPLNGEDASCPVSADLSLWLSSPDTVITNLVYAATMNVVTLGDGRTINLPGISVTIREMLDSLQRITDDETVRRVAFKPDAAINRIVTSWPGVLDNARSLQLGFKADLYFDDIIHQHIADRKVASP